MKCWTPTVRGHRPITTWLTWLPTGDRVIRVADIGRRYANPMHMLLGARWTADDDYGPTLTNRQCEVVIGRLVLGVVFVKHKRPYGGPIFPHKPDGDTIPVRLSEGGFLVEEDDQ